MAPKALALAALAALVLAAATLFPVAPPPSPAPRAFTGLTVNPQIGTEATTNALALSTELDWLSWLTPLLELPQDEALLDRATRELLGTLGVEQQTGEALAAYLNLVAVATLSRCLTESDERLDVTFRCAISASQLLMLVPSRANRSPCYAALPPRQGCLL